MKVIVISGLVSIEKMHLTSELAWHYASAGYRVQVLDNIARMALDTETLPVAPQRVEGDAIPHLPAILQASTSEVVIFAVTENAQPEALFMGLDVLRDHVPDLELHTLALIDLRTCDCFPHVREQWEMYADQAILLPYDLDQVLKGL